MLSLEAWFARVVHDFDFNIIQGDRYQMLLNGLGVTLTVALTAAVMGVLLGSLIALMRLSNWHIGRVYPLRAVATAYVDVIRGTPVVMQLLIMYFVIMSSYSGPKTLVAILTFGLNSAGYVSEVIRGGILAIDKGQTEAGRSLGLSGPSTMMLIVMPQAIKVVIPSLLNEFIMLLKETSVVGFIGLMDMAKASDYIRSRTFSAFFPLITVTVIYFVMITVLTHLFNRLERRLRQGDTH